jgi:hypothetical protein
MKGDGCERSGFERGNLDGGGGIFRFEKDDEGERVWMVLDYPHSWCVIFSFKTEYSILLIHILSSIFTTPASVFLHISPLWPTQNILTPPSPFLRFPPIPLFLRPPLRPGDASQAEHRRGEVELLCTHTRPSRTPPPSTSTAASSTICAWRTHVSLLGAREGGGGAR